MGFRFDSLRVFSHGAVSSTASGENEELASYDTPDDFFRRLLAKEASGGDAISILKFVDLLGSWQHCSSLSISGTPTRSEGLGFERLLDSRHVGITNSDMLAVPDPGHGPDSIRFSRSRDASVIANVVDPVTAKRISRAIRGNVARQGRSLFRRESSVALTPANTSVPDLSSSSSTKSPLRAEPAHRGYYEIDSARARGNTARTRTELGYKPELLWAAIFR